MYDHDPETGITILLNSLTIFMSLLWVKKSLVLTRAVTTMVLAAERISVGHAILLACPSSQGVSEGLPPILNFGKPAIRDKIVREVFEGKKLVCLAISEAFAGSDVAGLKCHAKRVDDGWVVTGT